MSVAYEPVHWTPHKRLYDRAMAIILLVYLLAFAAVQLVFFPKITPETLVIRATGTLAFLMLHVVLAIGPMCRLWPRFLPLLYNRRHLGVTLFVVAAVHGIFNIIQFHAFGDVGPLESLLTANTAFGSFARFPFQILGAAALVILFLMAATSHDFWLKNLGPRRWKWLHMGVYLAYGLLVMHVLLGVLQLEKSPVFYVLILLGMVVLCGLHLAAGFRQAKIDRLAAPVFLEKMEAEHPFVFACLVSEIPDDRAKMLIAGGQQIAIFKYENGSKISAVHNRCRHQGGPLSEGKIIDGCITCPWHGYQYRPGDGQSPPPFTEKLPTFDVKIIGEKVFVDPRPHPAGTAILPAEPPKNH